MASPSVGLGRRRSLRVWWWVTMLAAGLSTAAQTWAMRVGQTSDGRQDLNDTRGMVLSERSAESRARLAAQLRESEKREKTTGYWRSASTYTKEELYSKVTLIIKTFEREPCLLPYLKSVRDFYPGLRILIADDSKQIAETEEAASAIPNVTYFGLPFDTGVSAGRNFLLDHVRTPFFIVSDDDNRFSNATKLENILADIEASGADIVGACNDENGKDCIGDWDMYYKDRIVYADGRPDAYQSMVLKENVHHYNEVAHQRNGEVDFEKSPYCKEADMVANFFIARTAFAMSQVRWDPFFKVGEHEDYFHRAKQAHAYVRFCTSTVVHHEHSTCLKMNEKHNTWYKGFRGRVKQFLDHFFVKHAPINYLEAPWATIRWVCDCDDDEYVIHHREFCKKPMAERNDCKSTWESNDGNTTTEDAMRRAPQKSYLNEEAISADYPALQPYRPTMPPAKAAMQSKSLAKAMMAKGLAGDHLPGELSLGLTGLRHSVSHSLNEQAPALDMEHSEVETGGILKSRFDDDDRDVESEGA